MNQKRRLIIATLPCLLAFSALASCSSTSSSTSHASGTLTVQYFDDSPTPVRIGYSYVMPKGNANTMAHESKYEDGTSWNYVSRSKAALSKVGAYRQFDGWTAMDGGAIDLSSVTSDLSVKAHFSEKEYTYSVNFYNDDNVKLTTSPSGLSWGVAPSFPTLVSYQQVDYAHPQANTQGFWGYDFVNPSAGSSSAPNFALKSDANATSISTTLTFESGESKPDTAGVSGTLFAETALNDSYGCNPTYPVYLSDGTSWHSVGKMADGLAISFLAHYTKKAHEFSVKFYDKDPEKNNDETLLGEIKVPYTKAFTCVSASGTTTISYGTGSVAFSSSVASWSGRFINCDGQIYAGKAVDSYTIMADAEFYPTPA